MVMSICSSSATCWFPARPSCSPPPSSSGFPPPPPTTPQPSPLSTARSRRWSSSSPLKRIKPDKITQSVKTFSISTSSPVTASTPIIRIIRALVWYFQCRILLTPLLRTLLSFCFLEVFSSIQMHPSTMWREISSPRHTLARTAVLPAALPTTSYGLPPLSNPPPPQLRFSSASRTEVCPRGGCVYPTPKSTPAPGSMGIEKQK